MGTFFMDDKTLNTLEYHKVLQKLAAFTAFAVSNEKALEMRPTADITTARKWLAETREARQYFLTHNEQTIGGARDIRPFIDLAKLGGTLATQDLLDIKFTLVSARTLVRNFEKIITQFPHLYEIISQIVIPAGLIDTISRAISDHGDILDTASPTLNEIRRNLLITRERLLGKLQHMISDPGFATYLQESLITQRDGRYVLPLRAEYKGRIKSIIHDQSSSGATLFVEPVGVVELNNQNRELQLQERDEERRILYDLSQQVATHSASISQTLVTIAELDLIFARAKYSEALNASEPKLLDFSKPGKAILEKVPHHPGSCIHLYQARHPLLDQEKVIPIDVELDEFTYGLIVTGPNTGGKTVTLKTVGLIVLMAQSGLHVPVLSGSEISAFHQVFADIGDEQSIEQSLSTFSGHITNIIHIISKANPRSLVILDELGAGTDPQEGAALARSLLTHLLDKGITTLVTTHHPELKAFAHATPGVENACVEFDIETLRPTYRLTIGLPGRSNALAIAERLGMPNAIITQARSELNPQDIRVDDLLDEIFRQRELARQSRIAAEKQQKEIEKIQAELIERLEKIDEERQQIIMLAHQEAREQLEEIQTEIGLLRKEIIKAKQPLDSIKNIEVETNAIDQELSEFVEDQKVEIPMPRNRKKISIGDIVRVKSLNTKGLLVNIEDEEAEIQAGNFNIRSKLNDLEFISSTISEETQPPSSSTKVPFDTVSPGWELDLRGQRSDEALHHLESYLDSAFLAGLPFVRIIHGKGTGKLREMIRQEVIHYPHVASFEAGSEKEGGDGVTIVKIKS
jgi:DNA mismatch repair protein MutS2